jgi:DNA-directed RNA polymerase specialized sigma24 family protein
MAPITNLDETAVVSPAPAWSIVALDDALTAFSQVAPRQAKVVELRYLGGLTEEEIVAALKSRRGPSDAIGFSLRPGYCGN